MQTVKYKEKFPHSVNLVQVKESEFSFLHEDWLAELSNEEIIFYDEYIDLYEKSPKQFLEVLASRKKQKLRFKKVEKKNLKGNLKEQRERVQQFFERIPSTQYIKDIEYITDTSPFYVEKNVAEYVMGIKGEGDDWMPYELDCLREDKLTLNAELSFSVQAIIVFLFLNEMLHDTDELRIINCNCNYPEAVYAFNYSYAIQNKKLFQSLKADFQITSLMYTTLFYSKAMRLLTDALEIKTLSKDEQFKYEVLELLGEIEHQKVVQQYDCYKYYLDRKIKKLEARETTYIKKQTELQKKIEKQKDQLELQNEKVKQLKQELQGKDTVVVQNSALEAQLREQVKQLKQQLKEEKDEQKNAARGHQKIQKSLERKLSTSEEENKRLIADVSHLQSQLTAEKRQKIQAEELSFDAWLAKGPEYLVGMTDEQESQLKDFITMAQNILEESSLARTKCNLATNRIGYVRVDSDGHFINFGDNSWHTIEPFAAPIYLSDDQFIEVTNDLQFVRSFNYYYKEGPADFAIAHFAIVENRHNVAFAKVNGQTVEIKYKENAFIKDGQVISIDRSNELVSYYKSRLITLDDIYNAVELKGHKPLYVTNALTNGYVIRTLEGVESFEQYSDILTAHSFIIVDEDNQITYEDRTGAMLKRSSKYKEKLLASVSETNDEIFVLKVNEEYVKLRDVPDSIELELGDMVWVDEFNRFIAKVKEALGK